MNLNIEIWHSSIPDYLVFHHPISHSSLAHLEDTAVGGQIAPSCGHTVGLGGEMSLDYIGLDRIGLHTIELD